MRTWIVLAGLLMAAPALAQADKAVVRFYDFDAVRVDGGITHTPGLFLEKDPKIEHRSLVDLKHPVLPKLRRTAHEMTVRPAP